MAGSVPNIFSFVRCFADADAALEWLSQAFGFEQREVYHDDQGLIGHAEMSLGPGIIMFGPGDPASQGVYVAVESSQPNGTRTTSTSCWRKVAS